MTLYTNVDPSSSRQTTPAIRSAVVALAAGVMLVSAACGGGGSSPTAPTGSGSGSGSGTPTLQPTFASISSQILQARCVSCHNAGNQSNVANLNMESGAAYNNLVNVASTEKPALKRVSPGDPDGSYIVQKLEGRSDIVGARMPFGATPLTSDQIQVIRTWIQQGAPNN